MKLNLSELMSSTSDKSEQSTQYAYINRMKLKFLTSLFWFVWFVAHCTYHSQVHIKAAPSIWCLKWGWAMKSRFSSCLICHGVHYCTILNCFAHILKQLIKILCKSQIPPQFIFCKIFSNRIEKLLNTTFMLVAFYSSENYPFSS